MKLIFDLSQESLSHDRLPEVIRAVNEECAAELRVANKRKFFGFRISVFEFNPMKNKLSARETIRDHLLTIATYSIVCVALRLLDSSIYLLSSRGHRTLSISPYFSLVMAARECGEVRDILSSRAPQHLAPFGHTRCSL